MCHRALAGITHPEAALADELCRIAPRGPSVFFSDNGRRRSKCREDGRAVRAAERRAATPRSSRLKGLSRRDLWAASLGAWKFDGRSPASFSTACTSLAGRRRRRLALDDLGRILASASDETAAVVLEPRVQGAAGMRASTPPILRHARSLAIVTRFPVFDEVFSGYGRNIDVGSVPGRFARHPLPAKGFSAAFPMAATIMTEHISLVSWGQDTRLPLWPHLLRKPSARLSHEKRLHLPRRADPRLPR
jgi:adenosylmethionine-8-amino-7-oxononanoate aminotransferase